MKITNRTIICVCLVTVAVILGIIAYTVLKPKADVEQTSSETETTTTATENDISIIEPIIPSSKEVSKPIRSDPRVSVDSSGGVHIDVGGTNDNRHTDEPHISGDVFVIPDKKGDDE